MSLNDEAVVEQRTRASKEIGGPEITFVTGGTGFIGQHVVLRLLDRGRKVRLLTRRSRLPATLEGRGIEVVQGDLRHEATIRHCLKGVEVVYALGAHNEIWARRPEVFYELNKDAVTLLLREVNRTRSVRRVVYASSTAAIGAAQPGELGNEQTRFNLWSTRDHYAISKYLGELDVLRAVQQGAPVVLLNPTLVVGPGDWRPTPIGRFLCAFALGQMPFAVDARFNLVDVRDVAEAFLSAEERGEVGERYILGGHNVSSQKLVALIGTLVEGIFGRKVRVRFVPYHLAFAGIWLTEVCAAMLSRRPPVATHANMRMSRFNLFYDSNKATSALGWVPRPIEQSLEAALHWFAEAGMIPGVSYKRNCN